ncbi:MAG TPA: alpha/beta hydrolase [Sphingomicrobium sp.]|nr:alpha/beta hydrolase [Sphingomicrobium sp.]
MQQSRAPRPLPLFLELVRMVSEREPELAAKALQGLGKYEQAPRVAPREPKPLVATCGGVTMRDYGGSGPSAVLVPSLINPPSILDLDSDTSLADAVARMGRRALLVDWGEAAERRDLSVGDHVETALVPLLRDLGETPALIGYCLGGTMTVAAANFIPVERVITLAAPWRFSGYPRATRASLEQLWSSASPTAKEMGALPMEVLQSAFWSLDPKRTVAKFASFADFPPESPQAQRFVTLEDWANEGEPLPFPAARELMEDLFGANLPGKGEWRIGGRTMTDRLDCPMLNVTASKDRITPAATAPRGETVQVDSGHVGMIVGSARARLHRSLADFLSE